MKEQTCESEISRRKCTRWKIVSAALRMCVRENAKVKVHSEKWAYLRSVVVCGGFHHGFATVLAGSTWGKGERQLRRRGDVTQKR